MKFDILFSIMALREIEFFLKALPELKKKGYNNIGFITFHEAGDRILKKAEIPFFSMHKLADKHEIYENGEELSKKIESIYNIKSIRSLFTHDRLTLNKKDEDALLKKCAKYFSILENIFNENDVKFIVQELGGFIANQTVFYSAKKFGIKNIFIEPSMFSGRVLFTDSMFAKIDVNRIATEESNIKSQIELDKYLNTASVIIPDKDVHHFGDMGILKLINFNNWQKLIRKLFHKYITKEREEYNSISFTVISYIKKFYRRRRLSKYYGKPMYEEKYVYYPLHVPHDFQLYVRSPEYINQEALIEYLGMCLPYGYKLYVKEHPAAVGAHDLNSTIKYLKATNVKLIHPSFNSYDLIKNASCIVTVNSKVGVEALMQKKSVLVLGKAFYRGQGITHDIDSISELYNNFYDFFDKKPNKVDVEKFLARVYEDTFPGELYHQSDEKAYEFGNSLAAYIKYLDFKREK